MEDLKMVHISGLQGNVVTDFINLDFRTPFKMLPKVTAHI